MKKIVAITGGIASGKSICTNYIRTLGYTVIDADYITHELYRKKVFNDSLIKHFGNSILDGRTINRKKLGEIVFNDSSKRELLNKITHPIILEEMKKEIDKNKDEILFIDVPLLFEKGFIDLPTKIICISSSDNIRIERLMNRDNISRELAQKIINSQVSNDFIIKNSDIVIDHDNNDLEMFYHNIDNALKEVI